MEESHELAAPRSIVARENLPRLAANGAQEGPLIEEWLRFYPPIAMDRIAEVWGLSEDAVREALIDLVRTERVVVGDLLEPSPGARQLAPVARLAQVAQAAQVATVGVVETLLRWRRTAARPALQPLPISELPLFLAAWQGLAGKGARARARGDSGEGSQHGGEDLQAGLERLFGFPAPAELWESDLFPSRIEPYFPAWLDTLFEESELVWFGTGRERIALAFRPDLDLFLVPSGRGEPTPIEPLERTVLELMRGEARGLEIGELVERSGRSLATVGDALWALAWRGEATCSSLRVLRQGILNGFRGEVLGPRSGAPVDGAASAGDRRGGRRGLFRRWQRSAPLAGRWRALAVQGRTPEIDPLVEDERARERARLLLDRYGVLFRELLAAELPALSWSRVSRALRGLELSGEIVAGRFFDSLPGAQFALPSAVRRLRDGLPAGSVWWCSALDPASPCGLDLPALPGDLPRRVASNRLAYRGSRLCAVFARGGREIHFFVPPTGSWPGRAPRAAAQRVDPRRRTRDAVSMSSGSTTGRPVRAPILGLSRPSTRRSTVASCASDDATERGRRGRVSPRGRPLVGSLRGSRTARADAG